MIKKLLASLLIVGALLWNVTPVFAAVTIIEDFNSYDDGDLHGQGGWSGSTTFDVQGTTVQEGAKAITNSNSAAGTTITSSFTAVSSGTVTFSWYVRKTNTTTFDAFVRWAATDSNVCGGGYLTSTNSKAVFFTDAGEITGDVYAADTWVQFEMEFVFSTKKVRYRTDGGTWSTEGDLASCTSIGDVLIKKQNQVVTSYWDNFTYDDGVVAAAAAPKKVPDIISFF